MRIRAEVLSMETTGDCLRMRLQGRGEADAEWRPYLQLTLEIPDQLRNRRAYYVGRIITIKVDARQ